MSSRAAAPRRPASGRTGGGRPPRQAAATETTARGGGRPARTAAPARAARERTAPYSRPTGAGPAEGSTMLKVGGGTKPNAMAGALCNVVRTTEGNVPPAVMATGPAAINQAIKGLAIARKYLLEEETPLDLLISPQFEQDVREGSNLTFHTEVVAPIDREPAESDLSAKERTDAFKLAGAVAGRIRENEEVAITTKGSVPVLVAVKAIALAQDYVREEGIEIKFAVQFRDLTDPELRGSPESTFLHFAIVAGKLA